MTPIPTDNDVDSQSQVPAVSKKTPISLSAAERAAKAAGFEVIDAKALQAAGTFGEFVSQVGAIHLGRARLAVNMKHADDAIVVCRDMAKGAAEVEDQIGLMKLVADLIGKSNDAAEVLIKSAQTAAETAKVEAQTVLPGFAPRTTAGPTTGPQVLIKTENVTLTGDHE